MNSAMSHHFHPQTSIVTVVHNVYAAAISRHALRTAERALDNLDEDALKDIGLHRSEIQSAIINRGNERRNGAPRPH